MSQVTVAYWVKFFLLWDEAKPKKIAVLDFFHSVRQTLILSVWWHPINYTWMDSSTATVSCLDGSNEQFYCSLMKGVLLSVFYKKSLLVRSEYNTCSDFLPRIKSITNKIFKIYVKIITLQYSISLDFCYDASTSGEKFDLNLSKYLKKSTLCSNAISVKFMWCSWLLSTLWNSTSTKISEHLKLFSQRLQKLGGKKWPCVFFRISWKIVFLKSVNIAKILQWLRFLCIYWNSAKSL